jgi:hypothetical protein
MPPCNKKLQDVALPWNMSKVHFLTSMLENQDQMFWFFFPFYFSYQLNFIMLDDGYLS